jgi:hypothetical protein
LLSLGGVLVVELNRLVPGLEKVFDELRLPLRHFALDYEDVGDQSGLLSGGVKQPEIGVL